MFSKGSEWRMWDLHVHTPASYFNTKYSGSSPDEKWKEYFKALEELNDVSVLGITDYYSIDGYLKVKEYKNSGKLNNINLLLPNVELRLCHSTAKDKPVNIHVVFSPDVLNRITDDFFTQLRFSTNHGEYTCTKESLKRLGKAYKNSHPNITGCNYESIGAEQFKVDPDNLFTIIDNHFKDQALIILPNGEKDGASGLKHHSMLTVRETLYAKSHAIFSSKENDRLYFLGKNVDSEESIKTKYCSLMPCVHGSDSHKIDTICKPNDDRFNWIKADPTFDGLKQILFEPEERVIVQPKSPAAEFPKTHFSKLSFSGAIFNEIQRPKFDLTELPLNSGLVTIIGGRGTGKSLLLEAMKATFNKGAAEKNSSESQSEKIGTPNFTATLSKIDGEAIDFHLSNDTNPVDYLHVSQGEVKDIVGKKEEFGEKILELLNVKFDTSDNLIQQSISTELKEYIEIKDWLRKTDEQSNKVHSKRFLEKRKRHYEKLKETITTTDTKAKVLEYSKNASNIAKTNILKRELKELLSTIKDQLTKINDSIEKINAKGNTLSEKPLISKVDLSKQEQEIEQAIIASNEKDELLSQKNVQIEDELRAKGIKGDISGTLEKVTDYQQEIESATNLKEQNEQKTVRARKLCENRINFAQKLQMHFENAIDSFENKFKKLTNAKDLQEEHKEIITTLLNNISIEGEMVFKPEKFYDGLWKYIDGRKISQNKLREMFPINNADEYFSLISGEKIVCNGNNTFSSIDEFLKENYEAIKQPFQFLSFLHLDEYRDTFLKAIPSIKYYNKTPKQLSVGQRGTLYICIRLATSAFTTPFVFDQPEDDLDNSFIVKELTTIFRKIKKYRQLIIVTHNANLVVNADAEQVIVAQNDKETLSYFSGSLENPKIKKEVCDILEGGEVAFKQREKKYGLN